MKYLKLLWTGIGWLLDKLSKAFGFHDTTKRVLLAFVLYSCLATPFAVIEIIQIVQKVRAQNEALKENKTPATDLAAVPPPETHLSYPRSSTAGEIAGPGPHRLAKAKHPHYGIIPLPAAAGGTSTGGK